MSGGLGGFGSVGAVWRSWGGEVLLLGLCLEFGVFIFFGGGRGGLKAPKYGPRRLADGRTRGRAAHFATPETNLCSTVGRPRKGG